MIGYLKTLKPFLIYACLSLLNVMINLSLVLYPLKVENPDLLLAFVPYFKLASTLLGIFTMFLIIWTGFRISKYYNNWIWYSATAGISFYLFLILLSFFKALLFPFLQTLMYQIILGFPYFDKGSFNFAYLLSLLSLKVVKKISLWTVCGIVGGLLFNILENRNVWSKNCR